MVSVNVLISFFSVTSYLHLSPIPCTWLMRISCYVMGTEPKFQSGYNVEFDVSDILVSENGQHLNRKTINAGH